jgi:hypothetical protein
MARFRTAGLIAAAMLGAVSPALAEPASLRDMLGRQDDRRAEAPPVARYVVENEGFVLDRSNRVALLKFDRFTEVWVLYPSTAPRGDIIYRNDAGEPVLRATKLGGLTLFTRARPAGAPAAIDGEAPALKPQGPLTPGALLQKLAQSSVRATAAAKRLVPFEATGVTPGAEPVFADAAAITAEAVARLARSGEGRALLNRFRKVRLLAGRKPAVQVRAGVMQVIISPALGMAGRPSSDRVIIAVQDAQ